MLKALLKVNFSALASWLTGSGKRSGKKGGKGKAIVYGLLMLYALGVFCWLFGQIFALLAAPLYNAGCGWLYFVYVFIVAFAVMFIFSVFAAKNRLYEAKDNDLLLSMPIPPSVILASRMVLLFAMNFLFGVLIIAPALYRWYQLVPFGLGSFICVLAEFLGLCMFSLSLSALFGWLLSLVSSRMRKKALVETLISFVFLAAYFYVYSQLNKIIADLIANNTQIAASVSGIAPLYWIGAGAAGEFGSFAPGMLVMIVPFAVVYLILARTFIKTATTRRGTAKIKYEAKEQKVSSRSSALLGKEAARFFSSSTCIVNNGLGVVMIVVAAVAVLIYGDRLRQLMNMVMIPTDLAVCLGTVAAAMMAGLVVPTSSSVSLEGKSIWVIQSMPVDPAQVLLSKLKLSLIMFLPPVVFFMTALIVVFGTSAAVAVPALILSVAIIVVMAEIGLIANVNHPLLNWTSETQAIKNSGSIIISMVIDMVIVFTVGIGGYLMLTHDMSVETTLMVFAVVMLVAARALYGVIISKSARKFAFLG